MQRNPITPEGYVRLEADLKRHKSVLRPGVVKDIEEARAHGDISENSEYEDAKERQAMIEGRIIWLENQVVSAEVMVPAKLNTERIVFGATVSLERDDGLERTYQIVGESETDVDNGRVSFKSPIAKALIGKTEGSEVTVPAPGGPQVWEVLEINYR